MTLTYEELKERRKVSELSAEERAELRLSKRWERDLARIEKRRKKTILREIEESVALTEYLIYLGVDMDRMQYFTPKFVREAMGWKYMNFLT